MGTFNNKIEAEFNPPKQWVLSRALSYQNDKINIMALMDIGVNASGNRITENPRTISQAKKAADNIFLMAMKDSDPKVSSWKIYAAYYAVHWFGRWSIIPRGDDPNE